MSEKPNIIYMHSHDTGRYIQPYGHAIATPRLQEFAGQGVLFRQNFCINPTCSASRSALLTGTYPHENGMVGLAHRGFKFNNYSEHIIHTLHEAGYVSALSGTQHVAHANGGEGWKIIGYNRLVGGPHDGRDGAIEFLANPPAEPFFLSVGFGLTHRGFPLIEDAVDDPRYCLPPAPLPDTPETRQDMTRFKTSARRLDDRMGDVLAALEKSGKAENTLVIITTDHGIAFPRMKCNLHDFGIGTMLMMRMPGVFEDGKVVDGMTSHLDIFPTICEMVGIEKPDRLRGRSLLPFVQDNAEQVHDELFFEVNYHAAYEPMRAVRTNRWKYIKRFDGREKPVLVNCDAGESKSLWLDSGWAEQSVEEEMLFDLVFDPNEKRNLVGNEGASEVLADMKGRLDRWMNETNDPLLSGPIPAPEGAKVNDPDDITVR